MAGELDAEAIEKEGWRQGSVLGPALRGLACARAPAGVAVGEADWLIVTSHDCDVVSRQLDKEPVVEIIRAQVLNQKAPDKQQVWGRNPRVMQLAVDDGAGGQVVVSLKVHERWTLPREVLSTEKPARVIPEKPRRVISEWLAKRYIRSAFPTSFDGRWRNCLREWTRLLEKHSAWIQGIYLRLSSLAELDPGTPYLCDLIVAVPAAARNDPRWPAKRDELETEIEKFWAQFAGISCTGVDVRGTDEITLADIEPYQRFDADWVSFVDESPVTPPVVDLKT